MKRWWLRYLLIGLAAYGVVLIATFPAALALPMVQGMLRPVAVSGVEGSVWSGRAADVRYQRLSLGAVDWSLRPLSLLTGALGAALVLDGSLGQGQGVAGVQLGGDGYVEGFTGTASAAAVAPLLKLQAARPEGRIEFNLAELQFRGRVPVAASGEITWSQARVALPLPVDLGSFSATLSTDADGVRAVLRDRESPLILDAVLLLKGDGSYRLSGRLSAKNDAPAQLHDLLRTAGVRQPGAALPLNFSGRI